MKRIVSTRNQMPLFVDIFQTHASGRLFGNDVVCGGNICFSVRHKGNDLELILRAREIVVGVRCARDSVVIYLRSFASVDSGHRTSTAVTNKKTFQFICF